MGNDKIKLPELPVDPIRKKESLYKIQEAAAHKRLVYCPSWLEILKSQLSYTSRGYWIGQGAFAGVGIVLFLLLGNLSREDAPYLFYASVLAASIGIVTVMELGRSQSFQMGELEESCYFNLGQLWAIKMILSGSINVAILTGVIGGLSRKTDFGILALCLYILVPFVISHGCYLLLLFWGRNMGKKWPQITAAVFMGLAAMIPGAFPGVYRQMYLPVWGGVFLMGVVLLGLELHSLFKKLSVGGEKICWS